MPISSDDLRAVLEGATPGRRVQFHGKYCPEAVGTDFYKWDTSHDTSVILPDGQRYQGYATHKHARDAQLDALAPELAAEVLERRTQADRDRARIEALEGALRSVANIGITHSDTFERQISDARQIARAALANTASDNGGQHDRS